jgi:hypothetical protein
MEILELNEKFSYHLENLIRVIYDLEQRKSQHNYDTKDDDKKN